MNQDQAITTTNFKLTASLLALTALSVVGQLYIPIPIMPIFSEFFKVSSDQAAWVISIFGFAYAGGFLISGPLADKYGHKKVLIIGLFGLSFLSLIVSMANSFYFLLTARLLQGFIASMYAPAALALVHETF